MGTSKRQRRMDQRRGAILEDLEARVLLSHTIATLSRSLASASSVKDSPQYVLYAAAGSSTPLDTTGPEGFGPSTLLTAYGLTDVTGDGTGQTIAIVDAYNDPNIATDLHTFDAAYGLVNPTLVQINENGGTSLPGTDPEGRGDSWAVEISLDVEWAHAIAPGAKIVLVEASSDSDSDLMKAVNTARNYSGVSVVSLSWGGAESSTDTSSNSSFTTPSGHTGVTFVVSSGDDGAFGTGSSRTKSVEYPAASPNVVAVGGTTLTVDASGNYVSESGWGYGNLSAADGGSGGGISVYETQGTYQNGVVTQSTTKRTVPDVAADADPNSGVSVIDSWDSPSAPWMIVGGTSLAAPTWAGILAIADQGRAAAGESTLTSSQTLSLLYSAPSADFHDITTGNNGYAAGPGYDLVTGRGSPVANALVPYLVSGSTTTTPTPPTSPTPPTTSIPTIGSLSVSPLSLVAGTAAVLSAINVTDTSATITGVSFYLESNGTTGLQIGSDTSLGAGTKSGTTWSVSLSTTGTAAGTYTLYAVATDSNGSTSAVASTTLTVTAPAAPVNDNFANATLISGTSVHVTGTNVNATKEAGEPNIAGNAGGKSVWWVWTATTSGKVSLNTTGSNFDTLLGVYTGTSVSKLTTIASDDDNLALRSLTSALTFNAVAGTTYYIAVDGYRPPLGNAASGSIDLNLSEMAAPSNDNFANAAVLSGSSATWTGTNVGATKETGEPWIANNTGGASVWFSWTATTSGTMSLNTTGSNFDTILGVFTGSSVSHLTAIASNDDNLALRSLTSALTFNAVAGTTYYFVVDGYNGAMGNITLNLTTLAVTGSHHSK